MGCRLKNPGSHKVRRAAAVVGAVVLLLLVVVIATREDPVLGLFGPADSSRRDGPADCVASMMEAEQNGNVGAYLDCFAGSLRETLEARMASKPEEDVAAQLKGGTAALTGHAITDLEYPEPDTATLVLERIYRDYNERFDVRLNRIGGEWKIVELIPQERYAPEIPYGTKVYVPPPEEGNGTDE